MENLRGLAHWCYPSHSEEKRPSRADTPTTATAWLTYPSDSPIPTFRACLLHLFGHPEYWQISAINSINGCIKWTRTFQGPRLVLFESSMLWWCPRVASLCGDRAPAQTRKALRIERLALYCGIGAEPPSFSRILLRILQKGSGKMHVLSMLSTSHCFCKSKVFLPTQNFL